MWSSEDVTKFKSDGWKTVVKIAEEKCDENLLTRIKGVDLFAAEGCFHSSCRKRYTTDSGKGRSKDIEAMSHQKNLEEAHEHALTNVCEVIEREIVSKGEILKLSEICEMYITALASTPFANPQYRAEKLKTKLEKKFGKN